MPYTEFLEWIAYSRIEPFGDERGDWQAALIATITAEVHRDKKKRRKPYQPKDFLLEFQEPKRQTWQNQLQFVELLNQVFGGEDKRGARGEVGAQTDDESAGR